MYCKIFIFLPLATVKNSFAAAILQYVIKYVIKENKNENLLVKVS